jgi:hypothetical protein
LSTNMPSQQSIQREPSNCLILMPEVNMAQEQPFRHWTTAVRLVDQQASSDRK